MMLSYSCLAADPKPSPDEYSVKPERRTQAEVSEDSKDTHENSNLLPEEKSTPSRIELFVQPFTRWAEDQIHDTGLIWSPQVTEEKPPKKHVTVTLREAIQLATQQYPGTVLSANKVPDEETLSYQIKIISAQGLVKTIRITESHKNQKRKQ